MEHTNAKAVEETTCCIVGGGPAGAVLALLLARQGVPVVLLESHLDFDRDFRGDTLHPAIMELLDQIGLAEQVLELRHTKMHNIVMDTPAGGVGLEFSCVKTKFPYITVIAQSRFLEFITGQASQYPTFRLIMGAQVDEIIEEKGVVKGVRYRGQDGKHEIRAVLTVGADGRFSILRKLANFVLIKTSPPIDILWFRISRREDDPMNSLEGRIGTKKMAILINRFEYWQIGYVIPKGSYQHLRQLGLGHLRQSLEKLVPEIANRFDELTDWKLIAMLSIESGRIRRWYKPGLLLIGDAAHVMSPAGGVGINYAIQDAVVTANVLGPKLRAGLPISVHDLAQVQRQRGLAVRFIQAIQALMHYAVFAGIMRRSDAQSPPTPPFFVRWLLKLPIVCYLLARLIGFGLWPPRITVDNINNKLPPNEDM
jgi:2-polyprenyl-6-methoxyphenol hydroxylase-like FAD-dependent oxidoreductase